MQKIESIQGLRAIAALLVLVSHSLFALNGFLAAHDLSVGLTVPGGFGVDIFFVLSGFVMVYIAQQGLNGPGARTRFMVDRCVRIIPLYWCATGALLALFAVRSLVEGVALPEAPTWFASFLFFPLYSADLNGFFPILDVGWTLNYELFFYTLFALFFTRGLASGVVQITAVLCTLVAIGLFLSDTTSAAYFWTRPILLEFAAGMVLALVYQQGIRIKPIVALFLAASAPLWVLVDPLGIVELGRPTPNGFVRLFSWGVPALALVAAATLVAGPFAYRRWPILGYLGDRSYALYLLHPLVILVLTGLWMRLLVPGAAFDFIDPWVAGTLLLVLIPTLSVLASEVAFWLIERPASLLRHRLKQRDGNVPEQARGPLGAPLKPSKSLRGARK